MLDPKQTDARITKLEERFAFLLKEHNLAANATVDITNMQSERIRLLNGRVKALEAKLVMAGKAVEGFTNDLLRSVLLEAGVEAAEALKRAEEAAEALREHSGTMN